MKLMFPFSYNNDNGNCNSGDHQQALYYPSPLLVPNYDRLESQDHELIFLQHNDYIDDPQPLRAATSYDATLSHQTTGEKMVDCPNKNVSSSTDQEIPGRKRYNSSNRRRRGDRHSKIHTAQGPRDRRMRLSVKVARNFFDLQDKLGFDKASETVEWLLVQARTEINKLSAGSAALGSQTGTKSEEVLFEAKTTARCVKKVMRRTSKCTIFAKESREKARARARERTKEKLWSRRIIEGWKLYQEDQATNNNLNQLGCWNFPFQTGQESAMMRSHSCMNNPYMDASSFHEQGQLGSAGPNGVMNMADDEYSVEIMGKWSPSFSNHEQDYRAGIPQDHQLTDFESWHKTREAFVQH